MAVKAKEDENVVFSWIIWPSKEARDAGNKAAMADPRLANMGPDSMPFDGKRMFYGGFVPIVDRSKEGGSMAVIGTCLWFNHQAHEAARFSTGISPNRKYD